MTYSKPEVTNAVSNVAAIQSQNQKMNPNIPDSLGSSWPMQTSSAYEADE
jgi:hypothetical protein